METFTNLLIKSAWQVGETLAHNWPFLIASILIATGLKMYVDMEKVTKFLARNSRAGVLGATVIAVGTPLCSCGTTAVVLGMMASMMPWAPIVAFMVASPLTSPQELIYSAGLFGWPFALTFFAASILLGLLGGAAAGFMERRGWLANQTRLAMQGASAKPASSTCGCNQGAAPLYVYEFSVPVCGCAKPLATEPVCDCALPEPESNCACDIPETAMRESTFVDGSELKQVSAAGWMLFLGEAFTTGRRLLVMFLGFAFIGYVLNGLIPTAWVAAVFGKGAIYSVPLAATLGLPLYINSEASLPLVRALIEGGMSQGAALAFLITGAGTSIGAAAGALTIARWRVISLVVGTLWAGGIMVGYFYNFLLAAGLV